MLLLWRHRVKWDCDVIANVHNGCDECIIPIGCAIYAWNVRFAAHFILSYLVDYFISYVIKGIKNVCPCIGEIRGTCCCALAASLNSPTARAGPPTKAQPCMPMHKDYENNKICILQRDHQQISSFAIRMDTYETERLIGGKHQILRKIMVKYAFSYHPFNPKYIICTPVRSNVMIDPSQRNNSEK